MVNNIIDGISIKLNQVFEGNCKLYSDTVEQNLARPSFFIIVLNPSEKQIVGNRYFRQHLFDIHYFPENEGDNEEIQDVASQLFDALEYITISETDMIRGTNMRYEKIDGILHFFVEYNVFVYKETEPVEEMQTLVVNNEIKG